MNLTEIAQKHIERTMLELSGDDDFMPFMTIRDHRDEIVYVGMIMPDGSEARDELADMMTALCMVHRGVEATFASVTWMVVCTDGKMPGVAPSKHPDRSEQAILMTLDAEGKCTMSNAHVVRENNMIGVGLWSEWPQGADAFGRFADAIRMGIGLAERMPPELCEWIDDEEQAGRTEQLVARFAATINEARRSVCEQ